MIASRLVNELMLVAVLVAGEGAPSLVAELEAEGAAAALLAGEQPGEGFDLAILLATPDSAADPGTRQIVSSLAQASERLLFAPLPLGGQGAAGTPALPQLSAWFEVFAEFGYQPVVEFDAGFISAGAFLVDRAAVAAESELAIFADRLQLAASPDPVPPRPGEQDSGLRGKLAETEAALAAAREALDAKTAEIDGLLVEAGRSAEQAEAARQSAQALEDAQARWDGLRQWARALVADPARDSYAALIRDLPRLNAWRAPSLPIAPEMTLPPAPTRRFRLARFWPAWFGPAWFGNELRRQPRRHGPLAAILAEAALVRASDLFDAAWYVAATPELAGNADIDPVFHYVLVGGPNGADPGPWFDTATYLIDHPELAGTGQCPLAHAIRTKSQREINHE